MLLLSIALEVFWLAICYNEHQEGFGAVNPRGIVDCVSLGAYEAFDRVVHGGASPVASANYVK